MTVEADVLIALIPGAATVRQLAQVTGRSESAIRGNLWGMTRPAYPGAQVWVEKDRSYYRLTDRGLEVAKHRKRDRRGR